MIYIVRNRPRVYQDITQAIEYYFNLNPKLATQFLEDLQQTKNKLLKSPKGFQIKYKNTRTILFKKFPYHLYYIIQKNEIIIIAILHAQSGIKKINQI